MVIIATLDAARAALQDLITSAGRAVAFTGAGISTECGLPDFRSRNSPLPRLKPIEFDLFVNDVLLREEAWRRKFAVDDIYARAQPGRGHWALANLVSDRKISSIITQNTDNLHRLAGVGDEHLIELQGNGSHAVCLGCGKRHELSDIRQGFLATGAAPACRVCGGIVKAATTFFGEPLSEAAMQRAHEAATRCDLFLAVGSSLIAYPAASFPIIASQHGARLVIVNDEETPLDSRADLILRGDIGDIFEPFAV